MILSIIVAMGEDRAIGVNNRMPWRLSDDLKRFKALTTGHAVLMGRRTFESLPGGALPNRRNMVISRSISSLPGAEVYPTPEEALASLRETADEVFVIGGGTIYSALLPHADRIYLTLVQSTFPEADTFFPLITNEDWLLRSSEKHPADERNEYATCYMLLERR